jgi:hypothetical protein
LRGGSTQERALHKKEEAICLEPGDDNGLPLSYGSQAPILRAGGHLDEAMTLLKKSEFISLGDGRKPADFIL